MAMACEQQCREESILLIKQTLMDIITRRPLSEKLDNYCHVNCIKRLGLDNFKRNGRWGFTMVYGFTEIFSSTLALLNGLYTIFFYRKYLKPKMHKSVHKPLLEMQYCICMVAFLSSTLFHMRETNLTRYADYLSAYMSIIIGFICAFGRLIHCKAPALYPKYARYSPAVGLLVFALHTYKMVFIEWDYVYNKVVCGLIFGLMCLCDILVWAELRLMKSSRHIVSYIGSLFIAGLAEVSDIAPAWFLFDSHAMWHLCMFFSSVYYYLFISGYIDHFHPENKVF
ncbi:post-GPI attachment to proteins factor 3 [Pancytospora philotis]|nr:post-GPI attachment to proteins factor 3 [Pancytospora philotis]